MSRPGATYCDGCGASLLGQANYYLEGERKLYDHRVAMLFYLIGGTALLLGLGWLAMWWAFSAGFPGAWIVGALGAIGGLAVGALFIRWGHRLAKRGSI